MYIKKGDIVYHKNFQDLYEVVSYISNTNFQLKRYNSTDKVFGSSITFIEKVVTKETNPEYFL